MQLSSPRPPEPMTTPPATAPPILVCLPHAGGAARVFTSLAAALPHTDAALLELPGHGTRMREAPRDDFGAVLEDLVRGSAPHTSGRYVLLGHSMGAAFAYELARYWAAVGRAPAGVILAGRNGPTARRTLPDIHPLGAPQFLKAVRSLGGTPPQVFDNPELVKLFIPMLRADFTMSETYEALPGAPLDCPLWVCAGRDDPMVDDAGLHDWENHGSGEVRTEWLPGAHFILDTPEFHAYVAKVLAAPPG